MSNTATEEYVTHDAGQKEALKKSMWAIKQILDAILEALKEAGSTGVAGGTLYSAMMQFGCRMEQFEQLMQILIDAGRVKKLAHSHYVAI